MGKKHTVTFLSILILVCMLSACNSEKEATNTKGIYYEKINPKEIGLKYQPLASYRYSLLYYNGKMYSSRMNCVTSEKKEELQLDKVIGKKLATVYGNGGVYWATEKDKLLECTLDGELYQVQGYEEEDRVCIYYKIDMPLQEPTYARIVFDCLNDICVYKGEELYKNRFHLEKAVSVTLRYRIEEEECFSIENNSPAVADFVAALNDALFQKVSETEFMEQEEPEFVITFEDSMGVLTEVEVYQKGYVVYRSPEDTIFLLKLDEEICSVLMEQVGGKNREK